MQRDWVQLGEAVIDLNELIFIWERHALTRSGDSISLKKRVKSEHMPRSGWVSQGWFAFRPEVFRGLNLLSGSDEAGYGYRLCYMVRDRVRSLDFHTKWKIYMPAVVAAMRVFEDEKRFTPGEPGYLEAKADFDARSTAPTSSSCEARRTQ